MAASTRSFPVLAENSFLLLSAGRHPDGANRAAIPCVYCLQEIDASSFVFWSTAGLLLSATCTACRRRTTLRWTTWVRLSSPGARRAEVARRLSAVRRAG